MSMLVAVFLGCLLLGVGKPAQAAESQIDRYVRAEMELNSIPGLSLVIVEGGTVSYVQAYGVRSTASGQRMRVDTPVELASLSKAFTALAILRLEREELIERDYPVTHYFSVLDGAGWAHVKIRHLLQHRSGLRRRHDFQIPCCGLPREHDLSLVAERLAQTDLESPPGEAFSYANSNYSLLAAVVEQVSGLSFPEYMREKIFVPLGMHRTSLDEAQARSWGRADPHEWQWGRVLVSPSRFFGWYGASLVKSSAADMGVYLTSLLHPESTDAEAPLLGPRWWERLQEPYDLGWSVETQATGWEGGLVLQHTGDIWGGNTAALLVPRSRTAVAVLANLGVDRTNYIARAILLSLNGSALPQPQRMSSAEIPDVWARTFVALAAILLPAIVAYGLRVLRQVRHGVRTRQLTGWRIARTAVLVSLAVALIYAASAGSGPPFVAFPSTVKVALPLLVVSVAGLLFFAAALGLVPNRRVVR